LSGLNQASKLWLQMASQNQRLKVSRQMAGMILLIRLTMSPKKV